MRSSVQTGGLCDTGYAVFGGSNRYSLYLAQRLLESNAYVISMAKNDDQQYEMSRQLHQGIIPRHREAFHQVDFVDLRNNLGLRDFCRLWAKNGVCSPLTAVIYPMVFESPRVGSGLDRRKQRVFDLPSYILSVFSGFASLARAAAANELTGTTLIGLGILGRFSSWNAEAEATANRLMPTLQQLGGVRVVYKELGYRPPTEQVWKVVEEVLKT